MPGVEVGTDAHGQGHRLAGQRIAWGEVVGVLQAAQGGAVVHQFQLVGGKSAKDEFFHASLVVLPAETAAGMCTRSRQALSECPAPGNLHVIQSIPSL